jgi:hypothetical protein
MSTVAPDPTYTTPGWTFQANGSENVTAGAGTAPAGVNLNGLLAHSFPPENTEFTGTLNTAGTAYAAKVYLPGAAATSKGALNVTVVATTPTHGWVALYDASGNQKAITADLGSSAFASTGFQTFTWATALTVPAGFYYVAVLMVGGSAMKLGGTVTKNAFANANLSAVAGNLGYRFATWGTSLTALPAPNVMTSASADSTVQMWAGVL